MKNINSTESVESSKPNAVGRFVQGYKGFSPNLICKNFKYELDKINYENVKPKIGTTGLHFHKHLTGCFATYDNFDTNIFAKVYGFDHIDETDTGTYSTNSLMIIKILTKDEIAKIVADEQIAIKIKCNRETFHIDLVKEICTKIPNIIIGGSVGLFLQGYELDRCVTDLDLILPYWINIGEELKIPCVNTKAMNSGSDFDEQGYFDEGFNHIKYDLKINPHSKYDTIIFEGVKIKVVNWQQTLSYKLKYAMEGNEKHMSDVNKLFRK